MKQKVENEAPFGNALNNISMCPVVNETCVNCKAERERPAY